MNINVFLTSGIKRIGVILIPILFLFHSAAAQKESFEIRVTIQNLKAPAKLIMTARVVDQWKEFLIAT